MRPVRLLIVGATVLLFVTMFAACGKPSQQAQPSPRVPAQEPSARPSEPGRPLEVKNGSFELADYADGWHDLPKGYKIVSGIAAHGDRSLQIDVSDRQLTYFGVVNRPKGWRPLRRYRLEGYLKTENIAGTVSFVAGSGKKGQKDSLRFVAAPITGSQDWTKQELVFDTPAGAEFVQARVEYTRAENQAPGPAFVWVDALTVSELPSPRE